MTTASKHTPRERSLATLCRLSGLRLEELVLPAEPKGVGEEEDGECCWCWILNYGNGQTSKVRGGEAEVLPCAEDVEEVVELLGKPYALVRYCSARAAALAGTPSSTKSKSNTKALLARARPSAVFRVLSELDSRLPPAPVSTFTSASCMKTEVFATGLILIHEFLSRSEEERVMAGIRGAPEWEGPGRRKTMHFGPHFDYTTFAVDRSVDVPPPEWLRFFVGRLPVGVFTDERRRGDERETREGTQDEGEVNMTDERREKGERKKATVPNQFTVQYYPPGTGIPPHVDTHSAFGEELWSLSLGSPVPMTLRKCGLREARRMRLPKRSLTSTGPSAEAAPDKDIDKEKENGRERETEQEEKAEEWDLVLPARSLLLMTDAARYGYSHGIAPRKMDQVGRRVVNRQGRYSVTMRSVKEIAACECAWRDVCDAQIRRERERESSAEWRG